MASVILTKTLGTSVKLVLKRYGDGMLEFVPQYAETANTNTSTSITNVGDTSLLKVGMPVSGTGIPAGAKITAIVANTSVTISAAATATAAVTVTFDLVIGNRKPRFMSNARTKALFDALYAVT